jgi:hypothetical protein
MLAPETQSTALSSTKNWEGFDQRARSRETNADSQTLVQLAGNPREAKRRTLHGSVGILHSATRNPNSGMAIHESYEGVESPRMDKRVRIQQKEIFRAVRRLQPVVDDDVIAARKPAIGGNAVNSTQEPQPFPSIASRNRCSASPPVPFSHTATFRAGNTRNSVTNERRQSMVKSVTR